MRLYFLTTFLLVCPPHMPHGHSPPGSGCRRAAQERRSDYRPDREKGELIEDYPTNPRGPSCLVDGLTGAKP